MGVLFQLGFRLQKQHVKRQDVFLFALKRAASMRSSPSIRQAVISAVKGEGIHCPQICCSRAGSVDVNNVSDQKGKIFSRKQMASLQKGSLLLWLHREERRETCRSHEKPKC